MSRPRTIWSDPPPEGWWPYVVIIIAVPLLCFGIPLLVMGGRP